MDQYCSLKRILIEDNIYYNLFLVYKCDMTSNIPIKYVNWTYTAMTYKEKNEVLEHWLIERHFLRFCST